MHALYRYDDHLRLKVPPLLWVLILLGFRHTVSFLPFMQHAFPPLPELLAVWPLLFSDVLVLWVFITCGFRISDAKPWMKAAWHASRLVLMAAYALSAVVFVLYYASVFINPVDWAFLWVWGIFFFHGLVLVYLFRSRLIKDVFADFPDPEDGKRVQTQPMLLNERQRRGQGLLKKHAALPEETALREALAQNPESAPDWHALGLIAVRRGDMPRAADFVQQAVDMDGAKPLYLRDLGELYRRLDRLDEAITVAKAAVALSPEDADAHYNLALILMQAGQSSASLAHYQKATALRPTHAHAWNNMGVLLRSLGDENGARLAFAKALESQPDLEEARKNLRGNRP